MAQERQDAFVGYAEAMDWGAALIAAPVDWQKMLDGMDTSQRRAVVDGMDALIQKAARLRGYADERYGSGCGDQGHDSGVEESNKLVRKVRKALGFTYPDRGAIRF